MTGTVVADPTFGWLEGPKSQQQQQHFSMAGLRREHRSCGFHEPRGGRRASNREPMPLLAMGQVPANISKLHEPWSAVDIFGCQLAVGMVVQLTNGV